MFFHVRKKYAMKLRISSEFREGPRIHFRMRRAEMELLFEFSSRAALTAVVLLPIFIEKDTTQFQCKPFVTPDTDLRSSPRSFRVT